MEFRTSIFEYLSNRVSLVCQTCHHKLADKSLTTILTNNNFPHFQRCDTRRAEHDFQILKTTSREHLTLSLRGAERRVEVVIMMIRERSDERGRVKAAAEKLVQHRSHNSRTEKMMKKYRFFSFLHFPSS